ncbi:uncharacterized protein LOC120352305 [Nilaparvata lugens]|uniref:uncharacterized protein LOC120352305 n=1 Tax=Nilaparvata lugens TaxID=108931 RepID=UPI00193D81A8|nr:uncharacterized protein LOC120352305 [Nilaparvata lugens]
MYLSANKSYKLLCKLQKENYFKTLGDKFREIRDATEFWKLIKTIKPSKLKCSADITSDDWVNHFKRLLSLEGAADEFLYAAPRCENQLLDAEITDAEILEVLKKLKEGKAPGIDGIPGEFFKYAPRSFVALLRCFFNHAFEKGLQIKSK